MKNLERKEIEELMGDYCFGKLTQFEKEVFEKSIKNFPDLIDELNDVKNVFEKFDKEDFNKLNEQLSRNVSVKVQTKLSVKTIKSNLNSKFIFQYFVPTLAVFAFGWFVLNNYFNPLDLYLNEEEVSNKTNLIKKYELEAIFDEQTQNPELMHTNNILTIFNDEIIEDDYETELLLLISQGEDLDEEYEDFNRYILTYFKSLKYKVEDEKEFQELIKELSNEKSNS